MEQQFKLISSDKKKDQLYDLIADPGEANDLAKPNFLFIISDDQAPTMIDALGNPEVKTPHLDSLAKRGTTFTHCLNQGSWSGAVCVARRTMLITGQTVYRVPRNKPSLDQWAYAKGELAADQYPR